MELDKIRELVKLVEESQIQELAHGLRPLGAHPAPRTARGPRLTPPKSRSASFEGTGVAFSGVPPVLHPRKPRPEPPVHGTPGF